MSNASFRTGGGRWLALLCLLCCACTSAPVGSSATAFAQAPAVSDLYQIGTDDVLNVFVSQEPDLSVTVPVRSDGRISTPLVEDMVAVGKTPTQLARDIEDVLRQQDLRTPEVTVMVTSSAGGSLQSQIRVLGEVRNPGAFPFRNGMAVIDAITAAGGLTEFAAGRRGRVTRMVDGEQQEFEVNLKKLMQAGDLRHNLPLQPGDMVVVPGAVF
jgi:polysaccharide export outer membrane protein